jgi:apolipoprotein D and lipocalin family protein
MKKRKFGSVFIGLFLTSCLSTEPFTKTVEEVNLDRYLGTWYVIANRPTMFETDAYNATETYSLNQQIQKIDVDFRYKKGGFNGAEKTVPQTAWVQNKKTNAHWKISPWTWLPFINFDYLILDLDINYQWTVVGVPNQKYLWVMSRQPHMTDDLLLKILDRIKISGYNISDVNRVPQKW